MKVLYPHLTETQKQVLHTVLFAEVVGNCLDMAYLMWYRYGKLSLFE